MKHAVSPALLSCALLSCAAGGGGPPRAASLTTPDGRVHVPGPTGPGWRCLDRSLEHQGTARVSSFIHCQIQTPQGDLFLELVDREMESAGDVPPARELCEVRYPEIHRAEHPDARASGIREIAHQGRPGCEVTIDATDESGQPFRIVERIFVSGLHVVHESAAAPPAVLSARQADVERWFGEASFAALGEWESFP